MILGASTCSWASLNVCLNHQCLLTTLEEAIVSSFVPKVCYTALDVIGDIGSTLGASYSSSIIGMGSWDFLDANSSSNFTSLLTCMPYYQSSTTLYKDHSPWVLIYCHYLVDWWTSICKVEASKIPNPLLQNSFHCNVDLLVVSSYFVM